MECLKQLEGHIYGAHLKDIVKFDDPEAADTVVSKGVIEFSAFAELKDKISMACFLLHESNWYHNLPDVIFTKEYYEAEVGNWEITFTD